MKHPITQEFLKEILRYDPDTGHFIRLKRTTNSVYITPEEAHKVYLIEAKKYFGEFARAE